MIIQLACIVLQVTVVFLNIKPRTVTSLILTKSRECQNITIKKRSCLYEQNLWNKNKRVASEHFAGTCRANIVTWQIRLLDMHAFSTKTHFPCKLEVDKSRFLGKALEKVQVKVHLR